MPKIRTYVYKDIRPVAAMTRTLLGLSLLANLASMAATALQWKLFAGGDFTEAEGAANDLVMEVMAYLRIGIYVVTGVSVMVWSYRAHVNARAQGAVGLSDEPEIVAASYIIPFANFWIPFRCMRQLWKHSFPGAGAPGTSAMRPPAARLCQGSVAGASCCLSLTSERVEWLQPPHPLCCRDWPRAFGPLAEPDGAWK